MFVGILVVGKFLSGIYKMEKHMKSHTRRPSIWLMAADSLSVHSATTLARISFI